MSFMLSLSSVNPPHVPFEVDVSHEAFSALFTTKRPLSGMNSDVVDVFTFIRKAPFTLRARVRPLAAVNYLVLFKVAPSTESFSALFAGERLLSGVSFHVGIA